MAKFLGKKKNKELSFGRVFNVPRGRNILPEGRRNTWPVIHMWESPA